MVSVSFKPGVDVAPEEVFSETDEGGVELCLLLSFLQGQH